MREITDHIVKGDAANHQIRIFVMDEPSQGGACHQYKISWLNKSGLTENVLLEFQNGPINEVGINGVTGEALIAIVIDRLRGFQSGKFHCEENALSLARIQNGLHSLQARTRERISRNVEGTHQR